MKHYHYSALDDQGRPVRGVIEAADWENARLELAARGLSECQPLPVEAPAPLDAADADELSTYLSELASANLPLEAGLRGRRRFPAEPSLGLAGDAGG